MSAQEIAVNEECSDCSSAALPANNADASSYRSSSFSSPPTVEYQDLRSQMQSTSSEIDKKTAGSLARRIWALTILLAVLSVSGFFCLEFYGEEYGYYVTPT